jgi:hypothetical protein
MVSQSIKHAVCAIMVSVCIATVVSAMEVERSSQESPRGNSGSVSPVCLCVKVLSTTQVRCGSFPDLGADLRRGLLLGSFKTSGDDSAQGSPLEGRLRCPSSPWMENLTPIGVSTLHFPDRVFVMQVGPISKNLPSTDGLLQKKARIFKSSDFSSKNEDVVPSDLGTIFYAINRAKKEYTVTAIEMNEPLIHKTVAAESESAALAELKNELILFVTKEAEGDNYQLVNPLN